MKNESVLDYYVYNEKLYNTKDDYGFKNCKGSLIYEVIRVIDGIALFEEDHLDRIRKSAMILGHRVNKTNEEISKEIKILIDKNNIKNQNIKLICSSLEEENQDFLAYFIKSYYPEKEIYEKGIHTILFKSERENPNAKVINNDFRTQVNEEIKKQGAFEALLVNEEGFVTEGSRSNMFFIKDRKVFTAPAGDVLLGITRSEILKVCEELAIEVVEENIHINDLKNIDGAFMSGTSVGVLPISTIDNIRLASVSNDLIQKIGEGYSDKVSKYIQSKK
ncbi:aminotransferase, class IV [Gottschalkia purinilytica]|uniref:Aminotransferase, class IV n=1 Tax=Gottschalkia purinilytica TaxID=1503 RepID=A0A0L0W8M0_GOTPU|nr:aminotransferase class IV [Gottschalkia purinilytica]KNF07913.1 aminotransferase, class IV [Gottschalkia purinilytica]